MALTAAEKTQSDANPQKKECGLPGRKPLSKASIAPF